MTATEILQTFLQAEIEKDLKGKKSCFAGKVKAKSKQMQADYGGRFGTDSIGLTLQTVQSSEYRAPAKYCNGYLDKNGKPTTDEQSFVYRNCESPTEYKNLAVVAFTSSTSGTIEQEGLVFSVYHELTNKLIVKKDADYFPEPSEIYSSSQKNKVRCSLIKLP